MRQGDFSEFENPIVETESESSLVEEARAVTEQDTSTAVIDAPTIDSDPKPDETLDINVTQINYTVVEQEGSERPVIHIFGRTADDTIEHVRVHEFRPYFYAPLNEVNDTVIENTSGLSGWEATDANDQPYESIRGEPLAKIFGQTPRDVGQVRDQFTHYEADILFPNRFLIDKDITQGIRVTLRRSESNVIDVHHSEVEAIEMSANVRTCTFDIEVDDRRGFPEDGEEPIICLTTHDSFRNEYIAWLTVPDTGAGADITHLPEYESLQSAASIDVRPFSTEDAMLAAFLSYLDETDPDILTGWNFADFDAPYLLDRLEHLNPHSDHDLSYNRLSRVNEVWRSDWQGPNIKGRVVFDLLYAYQRTQFSELDSYRLDAVAEQELGVGKERYTGDLGDLWETNPTRLLEYNVRDVELCVEINNKQNIIPFWQEVASFVGCKLEDATTPGDAVDMYVLHKAHNKFVLPSKGQQQAEEFEGGAVFDPVSGVYENVSVLDLKSLYPMCMITINASPETKVPEDYEGESYRAPNGQHFRKTPDGIIREMVDELLTEREAKKDLRDSHDPETDDYHQYNRQQAAVKVIMNCFTPDTEVLTPDGVREITELEVGDDVYSLNPDTMEMEVKPVIDTHAYPDYRGELIDIKTRKIDFRVTPNHRMLVRKNDKNGIREDDWSFVEAEDLHDYCNYELPHAWSMEHGDSIDEIDLTTIVDSDYEVWVHPSIHGRTFTTELGWTPRRVPKADVGKTGYVFTVEEFEEHRDYIESVCEQSYIHSESGRKWIPRKYDGDDFLDLVAWYITEGSVYTSKEKWYGKQFSGSSTTVKLAQNELALPDGGDNGHTSIGALLDRMGFDYYVNDRGYQFTSKLLAETIRELCGGGSFTKRIPSFVFDLDEQSKRRFLNTLIAGDGDWQVNSWRYTTSSNRLRDDVLKLSVHLGLTPSYNRDSGSWRIYVTEGGKNTLRMYRAGGHSRAENGVYCATVADNNTLIAGRNGKFQISGNSLYGVSGWSRFRLYDKENAAAVTATGREVIRFTETAANELGYDVMYGDSVTGGRPVVVRDPGGLVRVVPIAELFEEGKVHGIDEVGVTADGGRVSRVNSGKDRRSLDGWAALSVNAAGESEWQPITQVIRHETEKPVVTLQHKFGESTTTRDHSYIVENEDGRLVEASPGDVAKPFRVSGLPAVDVVDRIDVYNVLSGYYREYKDGRSVGRENAVPKVKEVHADNEWVWFGHAHHNEFNGTVKVKRYIEMDSEAGASLVRLLAAYISEGSASTQETASRFGASIAESNREWLLGLQRDYEQLFENTTANIIRSDTGGDRTIEYPTDSGVNAVSYTDQTLKLQMMNELAAVFFREFAGQTSRGKRIPSFVYHVSDELQELFINTLIEGDGSRKFPRYSEAYAERNFDLETASRELAAGLSMLLIQRGQKHSLKYRESKDSYTIRTCESYRTGRAPVLTETEHDGYVYDLSVQDNQNFVDGVGGIVLHNTDSVMLALGTGVEKDEAVEESFEIAAYINDRYDELASELNAVEHRFQIEFEKLYRRFFQAGKKKRYAGHIIWKEGKDVDDIDITGFEYKRSDIAAITKRVQRTVLEQIVHGEDPGTIEDYVREVVETFRCGEHPLDEIGIPGGIGQRLSEYDNDTAHVRGARYANLLLGTNFRRGSKPRRLYLERVHPTYFERVQEERDDLAGESTYFEFKMNPDVICFEFADEIPEEFQVDWELMLDKTLKGPIERIIEAIGISWEKIEGEGEQHGLDQYM